MPKFVVLCTADDSSMWMEEIVIGKDAKDALMKVLQKHNGGWTNLEFEYPNDYNFEDALEGYELSLGQNDENRYDCLSWIGDLAKDKFAAFSNGNAGAVFVIEVAAFLESVSCKIANTSSPTGWYVTVTLPEPGGNTMADNIKKTVGREGRRIEVYPNDRLIFDNLTQAEAEKVVDDLATISTDLEVMMAEN